MNFDIGIPKYQHDCESCQFLGHFFSVDVYVCMYDKKFDDYIGTLIGRYSDEPSDNHTCPIHMLIELMQTWDNINMTVHEKGESKSVNKFDAYMGMPHYKAFVTVLSLGRLMEFYA